MAVVDCGRCGKAHPVVLRLCRTSRAHWNPAGRFNARPTHKNISALPSCWCRMIHSNVHGHSEKVFFFKKKNFVFRKHVKSQMITNGGERGISRNLFITKRIGRFPTTNSILLVRFSGTTRVVNTFFFLLSNRQHHLNTSCPRNNAPRTKSRPACSTLILRCRLFFCVRRRCRHGSNRTSVDGTKICAATTDDRNRSSTVCSCMLFTEAEVL